MKDTKSTLLERVSIRRYEREPIAEESMNFIFDAIRNTPTSYNGQQFSVIDISDQTIKEELYAITNQKQLKTCNRLLIFLADFNKIERLAEHRGIDIPPIRNTMDGVMLGVIDASLAMMSAVVAAESCGLGCNCIGYLRTADPEKIAEILNLPKGTFVVCGLAIGVPREHPDLKPKEPQSLVVFKNRYQNDEEMLTRLVDYDELIKEYNRTRAGGTSTNDWVAHILDYYRHACGYHILQYLREQGFDPTR